MRVTAIPEPAPASCLLCGREVWAVEEGDARRRRRWLTLDRITDGPEKWFTGHRCRRRRRPASWPV